MDKIIEGHYYFFRHRQEKLATKHMLARINDDGSFLIKSRGHSKWIIPEEDNWIWVMCGKDAPSYLLGEIICKRIGCE